MMVFDWQVNNYMDKDNFDMTTFFRNILLIRLCLYCVFIAQAFL